CDEQLPACKSCTFHRLDCQYRSLESLVHKNDSSIQIPRQNEVLQLDIRLLEANLLHHYYTDPDIIQTEDTHFWRSVIPKNAMREPFALESLLAFTALHKAYLETNQRRFWVMTALSYNDKACSKLSEIVGRISASTAQAALACSIFITLFVVAQHQFSTPFSYLGEVFRIKSLIQGCTLLCSQTLSSDSDIILSASQGEDSGNDKQISRERRANSKLHQQPDTYLSSPNHQVYIVTVKTLLDMFGGKNANGHLPSIYSWPHSFQGAFIDLLQARDFVARLIFLLYPWRLHIFKDYWYIGEFGEKLADELFPADEPIPADWMEIFQYLKEQFKSPAEST
ncbi:hypothetical protein N7466_001693, partial [Penicillium verhagenii]|uniref:uncharacterized protein n=1 Tax=Penicillium verhagenii TaxID=1562060 RepID=UPI002545471D